MPRSKLFSSVLVVLACSVAASVCPSGRAAQSIARVCNPVITTPVEVVSPARRNAAGTTVQPPLTDGSGFLWPDTQLGVIKTDGGYLFFGSDGGFHAVQHYNGKVYGNNKSGSDTRTVGTITNPLGSAPPIDATIYPNRAAAVNPHYDSYIYMGGGPVYQVPPGRVGAGNLLMLYHAELNTKALSYSTLNLAVSSDLGMRWSDIGEIIRFNRPYNPNDPPSLEIGDPNLTLSPHGDYFYVYFQDWLVDGTVTNLSLARAPVSNVLEAAFGGSVQRAARFMKHYQGAWEQPAIGGLSTDLAPNSPDGGGPQVAYDNALGRYVAISDVSQFMTYAESADAIHWTGTTVLNIPSPFFSAYATPVGMGDDPSILGSEFYIYYTDLPNVSW